MIPAPDYVDGFVVGVCITVSVIATAVAVALFWRELLAGLRDFGRAVRDIFDPPPIVLPRWVQRLLGRFRR